MPDDQSTPQPPTAQTPELASVAGTLRGIGDVVGTPVEIDVSIAGRAARSYRMIVGVGTWARLGELLPEDHHGVAVISDDQVWEIWGGVVESRLKALGERFTVYTFPPGDRHKTRTTKERLEDDLLADHWGRDVTVLAVGGGVVTDLAGFVAATYLRGVSYLSLPTTLLAMVDAAIGGKTAVNAPAGKNLIGAFHQPQAVVSDLQTLLTLKEPELATGLAETVKHAVMADGSLLDQLLADAAAIQKRSLDVLTRIVARSAGVKAEVVARDELDLGVRQILNFGHTIGHALEQASGYRISHGQGVSIGMAVEADAGVYAGLLASRVRDRIDSALQALDLPRYLPEGLVLPQVLSALVVDKKVRKGKVRFALPDEIGTAAPFDGRYTTPLPADAVKRALEDRVPR